jgi:hypothetical protein
MGDGRAGAREEFLSEIGKFPVRLFAQGYNCVPECALMDVYCKSRGEAGGWGRFDDVLNQRFI